MPYLLQQLANAVPLAALYAALAFGYALAFGMTRRPDITYGALFAFSGQIYLLFVEAGWNRLHLVFAAAIALGAGVALAYSLVTGFWIARSVTQPLYRRSPNAVLVAWLAVLVLLSESARLAMGSRALWLPPFLNHPVEFWRQGGFAVTLTVIQLINAAIMLAIVAAGHLVLTFGRAGRLWRAVSQDPFAAELCGTNSAGVFLASYGAATAIAAVCGLLATSYYGTMDFAAGLMFGLKVVLIAAAGGSAVPLRASAGAAAVGLVETLWSGYAPLVWRDLVVISLLVVVLVASRREPSVP